MHDPFVTTAPAPRCDTPALRLFSTAKRYSTWNPSDIDFSEMRPTGSAWASRSAA